MTDPEQRPRRRKRVKPGDLKALKSTLWSALEAARALLDDDDTDTRLRAVHATSQAATAYRALYEAAEFDARLSAVEEFQAKRGNT